MWRRGGEEVEIRLIDKIQIRSPCRAGRGYKPPTVMSLFLSSLIFVCVTLRFMAKLFRFRGQSALDVDEEHF